MLLIVQVERHLKAKVNHNCFLVIFLLFYSNDYVFRDPIETPCHPNQRKDLSKFKVLQILDSVMQVQDLTTKHIYILKVSRTLEKQANLRHIVKLIRFYDAHDCLSIFSQSIRISTNPKSFICQRISRSWCHW